MSTPEPGDPGFIEFHTKREWSEGDLRRLIADEFRQRGLVPDECGFFHRVPGQHDAECGGRQGGDGAQASTDEGLESLANGIILDYGFEAFDRVWRKRQAFPRKAE